jgi:hypothetical protein
MVLYVRNVCTNLYLPTMVCACMQKYVVHDCTMGSGLVYFMNKVIELRGIVGADSWRRR